MKLCLPFLFGAAVALPSVAPASISRVTNGANTPQGVAPWAVLLYDFTAGRTDYTYCGGAILDSTTILVAAHCIHDSKTGVIAPPNFMAVGFNSVNQSTMMHMSVNRAFVHPSFNPTTFENDVGVVKLSRPLTLTPGYAEALTIYDGQIKPRQEIYVHGWGQASAFTTGDSPPILQQGVVYAGDVDNCQAAYYLYTDNNDEQLCIDYRYSPGIGTCYGDSGSSATIVVDGVPYGAAVVSFNRYMAPAPNQCGTAGDYSFYTHTFHYLRWIESVAGTTYVTGPNGKGAANINSPTATPTPTPVAPAPTSTNRCLFFFCF